MDNESTRTIPRLQPIPQRVVSASWYWDSITQSNWVAIDFSCGHWDFSETLPSGFPSTESLMDAVLGCSPCAEEVAEGTKILKEMGLRP